MSRDFADWLSLVVMVPTGIFQVWFSLARFFRWWPWEFLSR